VPRLPSAPAHAGELPLVPVQFDARFTLDDVRGLLTSRSSIDAQAVVALVACA
jgi:hypothetical protein